MSNIEWTDETWNPVTGCSKVSQGCKFCYAEGVANRFWAKQYPQVNGRPRQFTDVQFHPERLDQPLRWQKPRRVFVNSMSDLFHESLDPMAIESVFSRMAMAPHHTFQVLTKRPERMRWWFSDEDSGLGLESRQMAVERIVAAVRGKAWNHLQWPLPNVWLGVSVEDQNTADERIPFLLQTPAAVRFVSYEPALGPVDFTRLRDDELGARWNALEMGLNWIIVGGESGPGARPMDLNWARAVNEQCRESRVAMFFKQYGSVLAKKYRFKDKKGGAVSEWPEHWPREFPR